MERNHQFSAIFWPLVPLTILVSCSSQPLSVYPVLEQTLESDAELDCPALDDELLKANAIRDAVFKEHGDVISGAYVGTAVDIALDPISGLLSGMTRSLSVSKATKTYIEAAAAAGLRMEQLLEYKQRDNCPSGPTGDPDMTDTTALIALQDLESKLGREEITQNKYLQDRKKLLDALR